MKVAYLCRYYIPEYAKVNGQPPSVHFICKRFHMGFILIRKDCFAVPNKFGFQIIRILF